MSTMITGGRNITNRDYVNAVLSTYDITLLLEGGAKGVDTLAKEYMISNNLGYKEFPANWDKFGKSAGFIRNLDMVEECFNLIAIWDGKSKGTNHAISAAIKSNKKVNVHLAINSTILDKDEPVDNSITQEELLKIFNIQDCNLDNKYEILLELEKQYIPDEPGNLLKLSSKVLLIPNDKIRFAFKTFLVTKLLLIVNEDGNKFIPLYNDLYYEAEFKKAPHLMRHIISNRMSPNEFANIQDVLEPKSDTLDIVLVKHPRMDVAIQVLEEAVSLPKEDYEVVLLTDSDMDGMTSCATGHRYFANEFGSNVTGFTNERRYGNGVNDYLVEQATKQYFKSGKDRKIFLIVTADHGSADEERYKQLKALGNNVRIIVTDHHLLPKDNDGVYMPPVSMDAFINPQDPESELPSYISGSAVLFSLFLNHTINHRKGNYHSLDYLMPYNCATTISDMMDVSKPINRYFFKQGIAKIRDTKFGVWVLFKELIKSDIYLTDSLSRGFIPFFNACNRMGEAFKGYRLLLTSSIDKTRERFTYVKSLNNKRRVLQKTLTKTIPNGVDSEYSVSVLLDTSTLKPEMLQHASGVIGIVANGIGDVYSKPCFVFVRQGDFLKCSGRGIIKNIALDRVSDYINLHNPELKFVAKGHRFACGGGIPINGRNVEDLIAEFRIWFDKAVYHQTNGELIMVSPIDVRVPLNDLNQSLINHLETLSPFGNGFLPPKFITEGLVSNVRQVNATMLTFKLIDVATGYRLPAMTFQSQSLPDINNGDFVEMVCELSLDGYSNMPTLYPSGGKILRKA